MRRAIVGFETDDLGDWVALLECGHRQHVRHSPPWQERTWVLSAEGRAGKIGSPLECRACDEASANEGGDTPCLAERICPECGRVVDEDGHQPGCAGVH